MVEPHANLKVGLCLHCRHYAVTSPYFAECCSILLACCMYTNQLPLLVMAELVL